MITAIVRFPLPKGTSLEAAKSMFEKSAPNYRNSQGLVRKYYLFGEDRLGGGVYLWENRSRRTTVLARVEGHDRGQVRNRAGDHVLQYACPRRQFGILAPGANAPRLRFEHGAHLPSIQTKRCALASSILPLFTAR